MKLRIAPILVHNVRIAAAIPARNRLPPQKESGGENPAASC
jgi:hypothetical protein